MAEKKYYWLKMTDQFFEDKAIKKLRKIAGGDTYTIIYLKMLLTAIKQGKQIVSYMWRLYNARTSHSRNRQ